MLRVLPKTTTEEILKNIDWAHRVHGKCIPSNGSPPYLVVKMVDREFSEKLKSASIQENQNAKIKILSQMYLKSLTLCQNQIQKHQYEMKEEDPSIQGYIRYIAILMIKRPVKKSIRFRRNFNFILFWHSVLVSFLLCSCSTCLCGL